MEKRENGIELTHYSLPLRNELCTDNLAIGIKKGTVILLYMGTEKGKNYSISLEYKLGEGVVRYSRHYLSEREALQRLKRAVDMFTEDERYKTDKLLLKVKKELEEL